MKIGKHKISNLSKVFIIAEVGINHGGNINKCLRLIKEAAKAGADAVKLQLIDPETSYQKKTKSYKVFSSAILNKKELIRAKKFANKSKVVLFATPGDFKSLKLIKILKFKAIKISSGLCTNIPLIKEAAKLNLPMILSTGMAYESEIAEAIKTVKKNSKKGVGVLKCTSIYPASFDTLNLNAIKEFKKKFKVPIGYSDHSLGIQACLSAVSLGAKIIEKHFTLNKKNKGADHKISSEPKEFSEMVKNIRDIEKMLGNSSIVPTKKEISLRSVFHRYLVAKKDILRGERISLSSIGIKRLFKYKKGALEPKFLNTIKGKTAKKNIYSDQQLSLKKVK